MRPLLALLALPSLAFAQVHATIHADPSRGATLLPDSVAWVDQATALSINPAGLNKVGTFELIWAHERSVPRDEVIDGLYFASSPVSSLGLGLSIEWLRNAVGDSASRKTSAGLAFGGEAVSLGFAANFFAGRGIDGLTSLDLGVQTRPGRYFSAGLTIKNVDSPGRGAISLPRTWDLGVGFRPLRERLTIGVDWIFSDNAALEASRLAYTVKGTIWRGLSAQAGFSHGFRTTDGLFFQFGVTVDTNHFGASYAISGASQGIGHLTTARLSYDKYQRLPLGGGKIAVIGLSNIGESDTGGTVATLLNLSAPDRYLRVLRTLENGAKDPQLKGVVLKIESSGRRLGRAQELREAILHLRAAGKKVVALILSAEDPEYFIASAADHVYAVPEAMVMVDGLRSSVIFLGGTAEKLGVTVDVAKIGAYKNSPDQFTRTSMSAEQKEALNALLDAQVKSIDAQVPAARSLTVEQWHASIDEGLKSVKRAKELKLIDDVLSANQLEELLPDLIPGARLVADYAPDEERDNRWGTPSHIAVIPVLGTISGGSNGSDPLGVTTSAGADSFIRTLDAAARDSDVAAIVLRVDSPGGDGLASDMMYRAVLAAKRYKPVVASMGDMAASGGYYVAMGADEIFASPSTITGSIGVFIIKPAVKELGEKLGAHQEEVSRGKLSGALDYWEPWNEEGRASVQKWIDDFYDTFITEAAVSRKTTKEAIDLVARGRVWSGADAKDKGLVDTLGGLTDAIASAGLRAGYSEGLPVKIYGQGGGLLSSVLADGAIARTLHETKLQIASPLPPGIARLGAQLGGGLLLGGPGIQARLEYQLDVR
jgi:protease-4